MDELVVAFKLRSVNINENLYRRDGFSYIKSRYIDEEVNPDGRLKKPRIGDSYLACGLVTSIVQRFKPFLNGWEVQTQNSIYRFFTASMLEVDNIAKDNNLNNKEEVGLVCYWT